MDAIKAGWFSEFSTLWPGQCMSLQIKEILHNKKSKFQDIIVADTMNYGRVLILDGVIQCTERDEFSYQEMITHLPVNSHPDPENVLVIGGGDGGAVRELDKHPAVKNITMCEIDEEVIEVSKKYLPNMSCGFNSKKLKLHIGDGFKFMEENKGKFDVIITDSSDPIGPASSLFEKSYYELMKKALKPGGIVCSQGECIWLHLDIIQDMQNFCKELYPVVDYSYCTIPTYPSGQIGFTLCSLNPVWPFL
ncbi:DgyrCDS4685 [Dimorphilus gyrociliatus]|uniref:Spermidine synthase n=1 Tax=Dimorphilus gyrociliatus TaxID=2664684 RepID=A0A7I8VHB9_9ANNE|nr:DgyrCDS4685 [Dimorphilus gyrociliatus]